MFNYKNSIFLTIAAIVIAVSGCKKNEIITPSYSEFVGATTVSSYFIPNDPNSTFKIPVGITNFSDKDRVINYTVTSPTGAASGQQYTISGNSITIPAGKVVDTITVKGLFAGYPAGRKDTLVITLSGGDVPVANYNNVYKVVMQKYCNVNLTTLLGDYSKSYDLQTGQPTYGPYATKITTPVAITPTKASIKIENFWDYGTTITAELDYTDPASFKASIPTQLLYNDPTYGPATIKQVGTGTFSSCDNTFTFSYTVTVAAGSFGNFTTTIAR